MREKSELYFEDPLLKLSVGTRLWAKSLKGIINTLALVAGVLMLFSDVTTIFWVGVLLLAYTLFKLGKSWRWWGVRRNFRGGNLLLYMEPEARELLEVATDRASLLGGSFLLNLMRELVDVSEIEEVLRRLDISRSEFAGQIDRYLQDERRLRETKAWRAARAEEVVVKAFTTQGGTKRPVSSRDLFRGLIYTENERVQRVFSLFGITPKGIEGNLRYNNLEHAG